MADEADPSRHIGVAKAVSKEFLDFEDAIQYFSGVDNGCDAIVIRDLSGFTPSEVPILSPEVFVQTLLGENFYPPTR